MARAHPPAPQPTRTPNAHFSLFAKKKSDMPHLCDTAALLYYIIYICSPGRAIKRRKKAAEK